MSVYDKIRGKGVAGAYISRQNVNSFAGVNISSEAIVQALVAAAATNSFTGLRVSSEATFQSITGASQWRGIATISSGTTAVTVSAASVVSGSVVLLSPYMPVNWQDSGQGVPVAVSSVEAGQFLITTGDSIMPTDDVPVAWAVFL